MLKPSKNFFSTRRLRAVGLTVVVFLAGVAVPTIYSQKRSGSARESLKTAIKLTRDNELKKSEAILRDLLATDPKNTDARTELAFNLTKQRQFVDAYETVLTVLDKDKKDSRALSVLGSILLASGRLREARAIIYRTLDLDRGEHLAWACLGMLDYYDNNVNQAINSLKQAIYLAPREPDYYFSLAQASVRADHYKDAATAYDRFLAVSGIMDTDRRERIKGLVSFLLYLGERPSLYDASGPDTTRFKFELDNNRPLIEVYLNGYEKPFRFVIDTGSGMTVISTKAAQVLGMKEVARGGNGRGVGGDGKFPIVYGFVNELKMGDVAVHNIPVYIRDVQSRSNIDGYLGLAVISKYFTTIDYGTNTVIMSKEDTGEVFSNENADHTLPLRLTPTGFLSGEVGVAGIEANLNFIVDTAASISVISDNVAAAEAIKKYLSDKRYKVVGTAGVVIDAPAFLLPRVTFGRNVRAPLVAVALDLDVINETSGFEQAGILGGNFLKNYRVAFDFKRSRVKLTPVVPENLDNAGIEP
ncbi:MAG: aspartyl protease family protein [Acidobacteria bacterium]|nr:aspartyl protease family protein [Acidobacteriota bacterium]